MKPLLLASLLGFSISQSVAADFNFHLFSPHKDNLVLMDLHVPRGESDMLNSWTSVVVKGLETRYEVISGDKVNRKTREVFNASSRGKDICEEAQCIKKITKDLEAKFVAIVLVTKHNSDYLMSLNIRNVTNGKTVLNETQTCRECDSIGVLNDLRVMSLIDPKHPEARHGRILDFSANYPTIDLKDVK